MVQVRVPDDAGGEILVSYGGDEPIRYRPQAGLVEVEDGHVDVFTRAVPGSEVAKPAAAPQPRPGKE